MRLLGHSWRLGAKGALAEPWFRVVSLILGDIFCNGGSKGIALSRLDHLAHSLTENIAFHR